MRKLKIISAVVGWGAIGSIAFGVAANLAVADEFTWTGADPGNNSWFSEDNWTKTTNFNANIFPINPDNAFVNDPLAPAIDTNAADALAAGQIEISAHLLNLGVGAAGAAVSGSMASDGVAIDLIQFRAGVASGTSAGATGTLATTNADLDTLLLTHVGLTTSTAVNASATGTVSIDGNLLGTAQSIIGAAGENASATGSGTVTIAGSASVGSTVVGQASDGSTAIGSLTVEGGDLTIAESGQLRVGSSFDAGSTATGVVDVQNGAIIGPPGTDTGSSQFAGSIRVGTASNIAGSGGTANGTVTADALNAVGGLVAASALHVGTASGDGTSATGSFIAPGTDGTNILVGQTFTVPQDAVAVGAVFGASGADQATATGALTLGGTVLAVPDGLNNGSFHYRANVGLLSGSGTADGTASLGGLGDYRTVRVGVADANAEAGNANGVLNIGAGGLFGEGGFFSSLQIGTTFGAAGADGSVIITGGDLTQFSGISGVRVGASIANSSSAAPLGLGKGALTVIEGSIDLTTLPESGIQNVGALFVGFADGTNGQSTSAMGEFSLLNTAPGHNMKVGFFAVGRGDAFPDAGSSANAQGTALVTNTDVSARALSIGTSSAFFDTSANVTGAATFENSIVNVENPGGFASVQIGSRSVGATSASGTLNLRDSQMTVQDNLLVASDPFSQGGVTGLLNLERSHLDIGGDMTLGDGTTLHFGIEGLLRGESYGAIDVAGVAALAGMAEIEFASGFDFAAALNMDIDLIIAETFSLTDAFTNEVFDTFFDAVGFVGLADGFVAKAFVVDGIDSDIFRVRLTRAPEPGALGLILAGLIGLGFAKRRRAA